MGNFQGIADISQQISLLQKIKLLENHAHVLSHGKNFPFLHGAQALSLKIYLSATGLFQIVDTTNQGGFSGTGKSDNALNASSPDGQINLIQCHKVLSVGFEGLAKPLDFYNIFILQLFPRTILCIILFRKSLIFQIRFCHFIFHKYPGASPDYWQSAKIASP